MDESTLYKFETNCRETAETYFHAATYRHAIWNLLEDHIRSKLKYGSEELTAEQITTLEDIRTFILSELDGAPL